MRCAGLVSGIIVIAVMMLLGGDLHISSGEHAIIIILWRVDRRYHDQVPARRDACTGLPLGAKFAFTMRPAVGA